MKKLLQLPWYPFFLAAYAVLSLLAHNITQVKYTAGIRPLLLSLLAAGFLFLVFRLAYRSWSRAGFVSTALLILFFTYGPVEDVIHAQWKIPSLSTWLLATWLVLTILILVVAGLRRLHFGALALGLNLASLGLLVYSLVPIVQWTASSPAAPPAVSQAADQGMTLPPSSQLPDIYYIMPEDYGRADLLQQMDGIDDSTFMQYLKDTGFYVAQCSQSNYVTSELSLGSSLNMDYLQDLGPGFAARSIDQNPIWSAIRYNALTPLLKSAGYKTVAFATGFAWSELDNSDVYISPSGVWSEMTGFESLLLRDTPVRQLEDLGVLNLDEIDGQRYRERTLLVFDSAARLAEMPGPKFVFMHIINPHPPFVFAADGTHTDPATFLNEDKLYTQAEYARGFRDQVPFVNAELEKTINTLIARSTRPLVIILQTDTGPWFTSGSDQFKILNAYYMPGHSAALYTSISPVNTFRVVLNAYLGAQLPLLDDTSYFSPIPQIYDFSKVSNGCRSGQGS